MIRRIKVVLKDKSTKIIDDPVIDGMTVITHAVGFGPLQDDNVIRALKKHKISKDQIKKISVEMIADTAPRIIY